MFNNLEFTEENADLIGSFTEKYFEEIVEEYLVDRLFQDFATTIDKKKFIDKIAGEESTFVNLFGGGGDENGDIK